MFTQTNWSYLLDPGLNTIYTDAFKEIPSILPILFDMQESEKAYEYDLQTDSLGELKSFNGVLEYKDLLQGYRTTYTPAKKSLAIKVERSLLKHDLYNIVEKAPRELAITVRRTREKDGTSVFNNAFNTGYTGGDSLCLCSSAHTSTNSSTTQSNAGSTAFSEAAVASTRKLMKAYLTGGDDKFLTNPDMLFGEITNEDKIYELINSKGKVDSPNNNINFHYGRYKMLIGDFLTSTNSWFMIDSTLMKLFLKWFDHDGPDFFNAGDFNNLSSSWAAYQESSYGWSDWRWVYGHTVA